MLRIFLFEFWLDVDMIDVEFCEKDQLDAVEQVVELRHCDVVCAVQVRLKMELFIIKVPHMYVVKLADACNFVYFAYD